MAPVSNDVYVLLNDNIKISVIKAITVQTKQKCLLCVNQLSSFPSYNNIKHSSRSPVIHEHDYIHKAKFGRVAAFKIFISWTFESRLLCNLTEISANNENA